MNFLKTGIPHSILQHIDVDVDIGDLSTGVGLIWDDIKGKFVPKTLTVVDPPGNDKEVIFNDNGTWGATSGLMFDKSTSELQTGIVKRKSSYTEKVSFIVPTNRSIYRAKLYHYDLTNGQVSYILFKVIYTHPQHNGYSVILVSYNQTANNIKPVINTILNFTPDDQCCLSHVMVDYHQGSKYLDIYLQFINITDEQINVEVITLDKTDTLNLDLQLDVNPSGVVTTSYINGFSFVIDSAGYKIDQSLLRSMNLEAINGTTDVIEFKDADGITHTLTFRGGVLYDYYNDQQSST